MAVRKRRRLPQACPIRVSSLDSGHPAKGARAASGCRDGRVVRLAHVLRGVEVLRRIALCDAGSRLRGDSRRVSGAWSCV